MRGETLVGGLAAHDERVSIHSPHTRGDRPVRQDAGGNRHFNPLPSHEGRLQILPQPTWQNDFNPLPSYEGRHGRTRLSFSSSTFQSTPLTRGETELDLTEFFGEPISIHSPHTRGDRISSGLNSSVTPFQSTPLIRGETRRPQPPSAQSKFQSTPLMRGETVIELTIPRGDTGFQSTPLIRGETQPKGGKAYGNQFQSTPLTRGETWAEDWRRTMKEFQSTPLSRGETA